MNLNLAQKTGWQKLEKLMVKYFATVYGATENRWKKRLKTDWSRLKKIENGLKQLKTDWNG